MSLRYMIESAIFFATMIYMQYLVSNLNQNLHETIHDYVQYKAVQTELGLRATNESAFARVLDSDDDEGDGNENEV